MLQSTSQLVIAVAVIVSVVASLLAWMAAVRSLNLASKLARTLKSVAEVELRIVELTDLCDATQKTVHKLRSRDTMRATRANGVDSDLQGAAWKAAMRKARIPGPQ